MKKYFNISAYTILEIIISMVIMSIIIGMTYTIFVMLIRRLDNYDTYTTSTNDYLSLDNTIKRDIYLAKNMYNLENSLSFFYENDTVNYVLKNDKIIRYKRGIPNHFNVTIKSMTCNSSSSLIREKRRTIHIEYQLFNQTFKAIYFKDFGAAQHINTIFF